MSPVDPFLTTAAYGIVRSAILSENFQFSREDAYRLKTLIDRRTIDLPQDEVVIIGGVQVVQSIAYPPQKVFAHPFTVGNFISRSDFNHPINVIQTGPERAQEFLTPLSESQRFLLDELQRADEAQEARESKY